MKNPAVNILHHSLAAAIYRDLPEVTELRRDRDTWNNCSQEEQFDKDAEILHEMANVYDEDHGVKNVVIWVGSVVNLPHGLRIKVSNIPNKFDRINNFTIQMPSLYYDPIKVARWIDDEKLQQILTWIRVNQKILYDYETGIMDNTRLFLQQLESWNSGSNKPDQGEK
jgi:hypothetical protein